MAYRPSDTLRAPATRTGTVMDHCVPSGLSHPLFRMVSASNVRPSPLCSTVLSANRSTSTVVASVALRANGNHGSCTVQVTDTSPR